MLFEAEVFKVFLLALVRFSGLFIGAPIIGSRNFPAMAKLGLAALCAMVVTPILPAQDPLPAEALPFALAGLGELLIGLGMGFVMTITLAAIQVAGQTMDMLSGFGMVNVFNPAMETQVPIFGFFYFILAILYILIVDGHHMMLTYLVVSLEHVPLGGLAARPDMYLQVGVLGRLMFIDGLLIAAPVAGALFLAYISMGILGRVVPQIHLFVVGFPLTVGMSMLLGLVFIEIYISLMDGLLGRMWRNVEQYILGLT